VRRTDQRRAAVFASYQRDVTGQAKPDDELTPFAKELVEGVAARRAELDQLISEQAIGWEVGRIAPLERAILRVALFEILHRPDVPDEVAIDEAVETAKDYCGAEAPTFINGILGGLMKRLSGGDRRSA
jgi:transcription antitermination protein NusB